MELIIFNDGLYSLVEVTKEMMNGIEIVSKVTCFDLCEILRLHLTTYSDVLNAHIMNDGSGNFYGCICK